MERFSPEHKFSKAISECLAELGEHQFLNGSDTYPWGGRNRIIARIAIFDKYLQPEDVLHAHWLQQQSLQKAPQDWRSMEVGIEYLNKVMDERSNGKFWDEMDALQQSGPTLFGYIEQAYGKPTWATPAGRRAVMHVVPTAVASPKPD